MKLVKNIRKLLIFPLCGFLCCPFVFAKQSDANVELYGKLLNGQEVYQHTLRSGNMTVKAINYGGIITDILVLDREGKIENVVLGYDKLLDYETKNRFFGAIVGRYANRIRDAQATINGRKVFLAANKGEHQIHGGNKGFDKVRWQGKLSRQLENHRHLYFRWPANPYNRLFFDHGSANSG
ncbi:hypothetical protein Q4602_12000 [Paraglaciecola chathamensis]|nr:hypothetical protein [Paraglaciecola chathamensis]MDO6840196.1 hypothetical protein [Paraglaciecola chathamensis]